MAAKEIWDYLNTTAVAADVIAAGSTLTTPYPQNILGENGEYNQVIHLGDDGSEERIGFSSTAVFYVTLKWVGLSDVDAGSIMDFQMSTAIGNGILNSFRWAHPTDGHTYTVRFDSKFSRTIKPGSLHSISKVKLKILGRAT